MKATLTFREERQLLQLMTRYHGAEIFELTITATSTKDRKEQLQLFREKMAFQFHRYMRTPHSEIYGIFSSDQVEKAR